MIDCSLALTGDKELLRMFQELPGAAQNRVLKPLVREAGKQLGQAVKSEAPRQSGLLQLAVGSSPLRSYKSGTLFITAGVRRGFKRKVARRRDGGLKYLGKKASAAKADLPTQDPAKYLHLVTKGRKAVEAINRKVLYDARTGRFFGKSVAAVQANPFVSRAFDNSKEAVTAELCAKAEDRVLAEASALLHQ